MQTPLSLSEATARTYTVQECVAAAEVTRHQLEGWLTRGFIKPQHKPAPPKPREFAYADIVNIAAFAEQVRLGLPVAKCIGAVLSMPGIHEQLGILVLWQGPVELFGTVDRKTKQPTSDKPHYAYDPANPHIQGSIVPVSSVPSMVDDPAKRSLAMVNLAHVEHRVLVKLASLGAGQA